jgi:uncharacterized FlaG/YvyC family protein
VTFSVDPVTRQAVIKVIESQTREVITQWPPEYALQLAEQDKTQTRASE